MSDIAPTLGRILHYRGKYGLQTMRAALVTATVDTLDPTGVERGDVPALDSPMHVHLWVYTPAQVGPNAEVGGFAEFNVPQGHTDDAGDDIPPGSWRWPVIYQRVESERGQ